MDFLNSILSAGRNLYGAYERNKDWVNPALSLGGDLLSNRADASHNDQYSEGLRNAIDYDYNNQRATYNAYVDYLNRSQAANDANAASASAAARANDAARRAAAQRAEAERRKFDKKQLGLFAPYVETGKRLLPQQERVYGGALNNLNLLNAYFSSPQFASQMNQSVPAYSLDVGLPGFK